MVRVFVPPFEEWENRSGASFGFRTDCWGKKRGKFKQEQYWPGLFINFRSATDRRFSQDSAFLTVRADQRGRDIRGPEITPGWWTMGMSVTGDGRCRSRRVAENQGAILPARDVQIGRWCLLRDLRHRHSGFFTGAPCNRRPGEKRRVGASIHCRRGTCGYHLAHRFNSSSCKNNPK